MEGGDALGLIAELSIAVAGFAGLSSAAIWTLSSSAMAALVAAVFIGTIHIGYGTFFPGLLALTAHSLFLFAYLLFAPSRAEVQA